MGYFTGEMIVHFIEPHKSNFLEMALHHIVALYLYGGLYLLNLWEIGMVIAFLHDFGDQFTSFTKFAVETTYGNLTGIAFVVNMLVWFVTRNVILPYYIYIIATEDMGELTVVSGFIKPFFCYLLGCMCLLHYYWFSMFLLVAKKFIKGGKLEDE